jgi:hypothetical protein
MERAEVAMEVQEDLVMEGLVEVVKGEVAGMGRGAEVKGVEVVQVRVAAEGAEGVESWVAGVEGS